MEFTPKTSKAPNKKYCCVRECTSKAERSRNLSFHTFPSEDQSVDIKDMFGNIVKTNRRKLWINKLKIGKSVTKYMYVCSQHFSKEDYRFPDEAAQARYLKLNAVPSANLPLLSISNNKNLQTAQPSSRSHRHHRNIEILAKENADPDLVEVAKLGLTASASRPEPYPDVAPSEFMSFPSERLGYRDVAVQVDESYFVSEAEVQTRPSMTHASTQVKSGDLIVPFTDAIDSEKKLKMATGLSSFIVLNLFCTFVSISLKRANTGSFSSKDRVILTLMKLKLNVTFVVLGILFRVSTNTCKTVFKNTLSVLAFGLKRCISWPSKKEVLSNMPSCFEKFKKVRIVLDCKEVFAMKSKCLKCRVMSYSHYKGCNTVKYLIGVTPAGVISYVSMGFGGRASDKAITEKCGIIDCLESYIDEVMVDKGFLIDNICEQNNIKVHRPPFLRKNKQFTKVQADSTREIARARVHVERAIQRIRIFQLLNTRLPWELVPLCDKMMIVAVAIANLSHPILADKRFNVQSSVDRIS